MDPLSITTAIVALGSTLIQLQILRANFTDAPDIIAVIENDCRVTTCVLEATKQVLSPRSKDDGDHDTPRVNMEDILRDNVAQFQLDIDALLSELKKLNTTHASRIGRLIQRGRMAWELRYLTAMHNKILAMQRQFEFMESYLQS